MINSFVPAIGVALVGAATMSAAAAAPPPASACLLHVRIADPDPAGTHVRAGPSAQAPIVALLPHDRPAAGDRFVPELEVTGFVRGWARVRRVRFADYGKGERMLFADSGWIAGRLLSASLTRLPAIAGMAPRRSVDGATIEAIDDCRGSKAHVTVRFGDGRRLTGWTDGLCANQATTCA